LQPIEVVMHHRRAHPLLLSFGGALAWIMLSCLVAGPAWAHFGEAAHAGWSEGFAHPFSGIDHVVAMVALGVWAAQLGRRALWLIPLTFPASMAVGAALALQGVALPFAEDGVAISVAVLGVVLAVTSRPGLAAALGAAALFGLFHGYAHGVEMPFAAAPKLYALGFMSATMLLHGIGIALGRIAQSQRGQRLLPFGAAAVAGTGIALVIAL
jgi:urease accessory protein